MWYRLQNWIQSFKTYSALSPDLQARRRVYQLLNQRPLLSLSEWHALYGKPWHISYGITEFAYGHLGKYSGLEFGRLLPGDRLDEDLCWTKICWFDWYLELCDDFHQRFEKDLSEDVADLPNTTLVDLLQFLEDRHPRPPKSCRSAPHDPC